MKKYFTIAVAALALAACDKNNDDFNIDNLKDTPITIASAGVAELSTRANVDGKLVGTWDDPVSLSVFVTDGWEEKYNATNMQWTHDGTIWTSESTVLYGGTGSEQKIYACSPYVEDGASGSIAVTATDRIDWLVATSTPLTSYRVELTMTHALAKLVVFKPTFGSEIAEDDQEISKVEIEGMYASGTLRLSDNTWSGLSEANATLQMDVWHEALVIPMESCESFPITITMKDGRVFKTTISLSEVGSKLAAGTQYNIALQIGQDKVTLGGITASPWTQTLGGELETE